MFGQDHLAAQHLAYRPVIGRRRSPEPDHGHTKAGGELYHAAVVFQPGGHERMARQNLGGLAIERVILVKGCFQKAIDSLGGQLVDDRGGKGFAICGKAIACAVAAAGEQFQRLGGGGAVPAVQASKHVAGIRRGHA